MAVVSSDRAEMPILHLWDIPTHRQTANLLGQMDFASSLAFSPDGRLLASGNGDSTALAFSPDGNTLVSGGIDGTVRLWRAVSLAEADAPARPR
jgi:WD40 repeat protein